ncbi:RidA family protein [Anaerobranca gottschalkii]|uniref:Endoribonuclease L-PSP n=1 Tax=Anaerobranca gottschalkii DSM 13577 TaxID=1120990 RepID=A0A1I0ABB8_9FIRM|nr:RidA family protein [Anaerobranca gottschalkii]SES91519.1 endoribonuclease L-PSP [Anaerobranca gottschalkii DSM 13577]
MKEVIKTDKAPAAIGPYSQGIRIKNFIFTSGQLPLTVDGIINEDVQEQTRQSLENVKAVLEAQGASMQDVIKCTVFIKDMNDFPKINEIYSQYFTEPYPARSCVEVARLPKDVKVEIEAIAVIRES